MSGAPRLRQYSLVLPAPLIDRLKLAAIITNRTQKELAAAALSEYLDRLGVAKQVPPLTPQPKRKER